MESRIRTAVASTFALSVGLVLAAGACSSDGSQSECSVDSDCPDEVSCVDGVCLAEGDDDSEIGGRDGSGGPDGADDTSGPPGEDSYGVDGWPPPPDVYEDTGFFEDAESDDTGPSRALSCHEFAICQWIACERYDYSCKADYQERTSERQISQLDDRQTCMRDNCSGLQGVDRIECAVQNCESEWETCANRPESGDDLDCGEFHACAHLCNGTENRQGCLADCQSRATMSAQRGLQNYHECVDANCRGTQGREHLKCVRNNCLAELSACWGC